MESLGEKLRNTRTEKGLGFDQIARETNISIRFLEALEAENFTVFPAETYITGFLRNYGAYLDLDVQELLSLYRAFRIQEQPVPVEQLLKPHHSQAPRIIAAIAVVLIILAAGGGGAYYLLFARPKAPVVNVIESRAPAEYMMDGNSLERRLYKDDSVLIPVDAVTYRLELINLGETVMIRTPAGTVILDLSQEANVDLNNNGIPDLRITVADFAKNNADMGALIHFYLTDSMAGNEAARDTAQNQVMPVNIAGAASTTVIPSSPNAYPITLQSNFQGYCMFRWEILNERDRRDRNERYFQRADELNIQAQNGIRIWTSNAQAAKFQVIGAGRTFPLELGTAGEVVVADIRWVRDDDNRYRLVLVRLESGSS